MPHQTYREKVRSSVSIATDVRFEPGSDTVVAVASLVVLWGIYYFQSISDSLESILLFLFVGNLTLTILLPLYYVCHVREEPLSAVGITTEGWKRAVLVSTIGGLALLPGLFVVDESLSVLVPHVITVGLMLWEPFFVHGWLQIRFERAFGAGPGIVLAAAAFCLFHVGAVPLASLFVLFFFGFVHAVLFRAFNRNILVLWPILWAIGSSRGTLDTIVFGWEEASSYVLILLVALGAIYITQNRTAQIGRT